MLLENNNMNDKIKGTLIEELGIQFVETNDEQSLEATMVVTQKHLQTMGVMHGGATISLAESVAGVGSNLVCSEEDQCFGMQISASHISSAHLGDTVRAVGTILHKGRSTHVWDVDIVSETTGRLISSIKVTNAVVKKRK